MGNEEVRPTNPPRPKQPPGTNAKRKRAARPVRYVMIDQGHGPAEYWVKAKVVGRQLGKDLFTEKPTEQLLVEIPGGARVWAAFWRELLTVEVYMGCPWCGQSPIVDPEGCRPRRCYCANHECVGYGHIVDLDKWNIRYQPNAPPSRPSAGAAKEA